MTVPPSPPPGAPSGWNPPPAGTDWSSAPAAPAYPAQGYPAPGSPQAGYGQGGYGQGGYEQGGYEQGGPGPGQYGQGGDYGQGGPGPGQYGQGAFGPGEYGQGGYPPPGLPPAGPKPGTNGFAIAALIFGIIGGVVLAVIFGIIGLNQTKKTGQGGRGLALAGLILSGVWLIGIVVVIVIAVTSSAKRDDAGTINTGGSVPATALKVGDCVNNLADNNNLLSLPAVPCSTAHEGEVFAVFDLPDGAYPDPGSEGIPDSITQECSTRFGAYAPTADLDAVGLYVVYPRPTNWTRGDRTVDCIATANGGKTTGSVKGS